MSDDLGNDDVYIRHLLDTIERLDERVDWLECLEAAGVDNWSGIEEAQRIRDEDPYGT